MKTPVKYAALALFAAASVYFGHIGWPTAPRIPSDLRDAPSDPAAPTARSEAAQTGEEKLLSAFHGLKLHTGAAGNTPFDMLSDLFERATPAQAEDVTGWFYTLVARSPEKAFFGMSGGALEAGSGEAHSRVRTAQQIFEKDFDLDTPVSAGLMEKLDAELNNSPVVIKFPHGVWQKKMSKGIFRIAYRKYGTYVVVKTEGPVIEGAGPPFNYPVFYTCFIKRASR